MKVASWFISQPDHGPVDRLFLGDFERLFLATYVESVEPNTAAVVGPTAYSRHEIPAWNRALHTIAARLGHPQHPLPAWLVLHDHS